MNRYELGHLIVWQTPFLLVYFMMHQGSEAATNIFMFFGYIAVFLAVCFSIVAVGGGDTYGDTEKRIKELEERGLTEYSYPFRAIDLFLDLVPAVISAAMGWYFFAGSFVILASYAWKYRERVNEQLQEKISSGV